MVVCEVNILSLMIYVFNNLIMWSKVKIFNFLTILHVRFIKVNVVKLMKKGINYDINVSIYN